VRGIYKG